ncbi:hypothetical protein [Bifidobacterium bombi]|uniref:hypothetical protein n=1 Tax=Bifidobacterium bombi TaxID=471511 RepID=UPI00126A5F36|nr:hypothetical protein [Bifidobacterium bombi]
MTVHIMKQHRCEPHMGRFTIRNGISLRIRPGASNTAYPAQAQPHGAAHHRKQRVAFGLLQEVTKLGRINGKERSPYCFIFHKLKIDA